jgi:hypothetical protein
MLLEGCTDGIELVGGLRSLHLPTVRDKGRCGKRARLIFSLASMNRIADRKH